MAKFQLTISADYVPTWGVYEGIREVIQNALDGDQDGFTLEIIPPTDTNRTLQVRSHGAQLDRAVWLMGTTSKLDGNHRGCYGEGLKLAALALARAGRKISFANGSEDWRVRLEPSRTFNDRPVVTVYTVKRAVAADVFTVRIECSPAEWQEYSAAFLDLQPNGNLIKGDTWGGDLLLDPERAGQLFVKGILVETRENYFCGYNFRSAATDRDRRIINSFDLDWGTSRIWERALMDDGNSITPEFVLDFLMAAPRDADCFRTKTFGSEPQELVAEAWRNRHGSQAVPVSDQASADSAGHIGRRGIVVPAPVVQFFTGHADLDLDLLRVTQRANVLRTYEPHELSNSEAHNLGTAIQLISLNVSAVPGLKPLVGRTSAADFSNPEVQGLALCGKDGSDQIYIARRCLRSLPRALEVLAHEAAHDLGGDGSAVHQRAEGALFSHMVASLIEPAASARPLAAV